MGRYPVRTFGVAIAVMAAASGAVAMASDATAASAGTDCGAVRERTGSTAPVIVLTGDVDCATVLQVAAGYINRTPDPDGGTLQLATIDGWQCSVPLVAGRSHADSYLECDLGSNSFKIGE